MATEKLEAQAGKLNIVIEQGTTFNPVMTYSDENDAPITLVGYTARMQIREDYDATTTYEELTTENGGITLGGAAGTITLLITDTATAAYTWDCGVYDLELISAGGVVTRLLKGGVAISPEVTK